MAPSANLIRLYLGAGWSPSGARKAGASLGATGYAGGVIARQQLLTESLRKKRITPDQLGPQDKAILGMGITDAKSPNLASRTLHAGGIFDKGIGLLSNFGSDVFQAGKEFVPGIYETGKAALHDALSMQSPGLSVDSTSGGLKQGGHSELRDKVVDPTLASYKYMYGPAFSGDIGKTLERAYEHPLQPVLDLATVGSLGLGSAAKVGGIAARAGSESAIGRAGASLAKLTSPEGRTGLDLGEGNVLPRDYSQAPLRRIAQQIGDKAGAAFDPLGNLQKRRAISLDMRRQGADQMAQISQNTERAVAPLADALRAMDADETMAFGLVTRGINDASSLEHFQDSVRKSLRNEHEGEHEGRNFSHFEELGGSKKTAEAFLNLSPRTIQLVMNPAESPNIRRTAQLWNQNVQRMREAGQLDTEQIQTKLDRRGDELGGRGQWPEDRQIETDYMPDTLASGMSKEYGPVGKMLGKKGAKREKRAMSTRTVTQQNLLGTSKRLMDDSSMDTFMAGMFRTDGRALLDHVARGEKAIVENGFNQQLILDYALRDADGKFRMFSNTRQVPKGYTLVHDKFPVQWFHGEYNMLQGLMDRVQALKQHDFDEFSPEALNDLMKYEDNDAKAFVVSNWSALKQKGYAIPDHVFDYQMKLATVNDPFKYASASWLARAMHRWRTATLAYMPRWALNTAVGSFLTAMIKGVVRPGDYITANRLNRTSIDMAGNRIVKPASFQGLRLNPTRSTQVLEGALGKGIKKDYIDEEGNVVTLPENPDDRITEPLLPAGVSLKSVSLQDYLEPGAVGADYDLIGTTRFNSKHIVDFVQSSEDFFRRAHFVKNLRGEAKQLMRDRGDSLKNFYKDLGDKPNVEQWLDDPELQRRALDDTNRWSYSYGELSPFERRYVRQAIPFWGWYKFITKFAWRLGVENPGRAQIINFLGQVGQDAQDELGLVPPWVRGSIILNATQKNNVKYLSTAGLNPLASFAIPFGPQGAQSLLQMGQASPALQAWLAWQGYDTLRGGEVPISPMEGIGAGMFGQSVDVNTGEDVNLATRGSFRRGLMTPLRSVPQFRMLENYLMGGSVYPESVPFIAPRPMARAEGSQPESLADSVITPSLGFNENTIDLAKYQMRARQNAALARTKANANLRRIARTTQ